MYNCTSPVPFARKKYCKPGKQLHEIANAKSLNPERAVWIFKKKEAIIWMTPWEFQIIRQLVGQLQDAILFTMSRRTTRILDTYGDSYYLYRYTICLVSCWNILFVVVSIMGDLFHRLASFRRLCRASFRRQSTTLKDNAPDSCLVSVCDVHGCKIPT